MCIFDNYSHEFKTRRIFELWIKSCYCNDVTTTMTTIKQYKHNHNNQFDPIVLALPHPITGLLQSCVLVSFAFF